MIFMFLPYRAGNLVVPNLGADVTSDVTSSAGPVRMADLQRILSSIGPQGIICYSLSLMPLLFCNLFS